ncbi:MAG: glycosyltransferase family 9 protein [Bacteroidales bacterium]|nr:glycosyltransferase family 9 protein [Bacteroidales bacterium]
MNPEQPTGPQGIRKLLVFRFSAMGDVALVLPVIRGLLDTYKTVEITLVTRKQFEPFFINIERLKIIAPEFAGRHKGFIGILRLWLNLKNSGKYNAVIDLHGVLRTYILRLFFTMGAVCCYSINKGRREKKAWLQNAGTAYLKHTTIRYLEVFNRAGYFFDLKKGCVFATNSIAKSEPGFLVQKLADRNSIRIGIAPFAKHELKVYPAAKMYALLEKLSGKSFEVFLFGGGKEEKERLREMALISDKFHVVDLSLAAEIRLMQQLNLMISMDSANMHIASLAGIPVISVWGATHRGIGFAPLNQPEANFIETPTVVLPCRPCSIYGKGKCLRGDFACMDLIEPDTILKRVFEIVEPVK